LPRFQSFDAGQEATLRAGMHGTAARVESLSATDRRPESADRSQDIEALRQEQSDKLVLPAESSIKKAHHPSLASAKKPDVVAPSYHHYAGAGRGDHDGFRRSERSAEAASFLKAIVWPVRISRTMQMTIPIARLAMISALLIAGLAATGLPMQTDQKPDPAGDNPATSAKAVNEREPADPRERIEMVTVRVINPRGQGVPNVEVEVLAHGLDHQGLRYRASDDGLVKIPVESRADPSSGTRFLARPDVQTLGWALLPRPQDRRHQ
jgi:hypothetical protein